MSVPTRTVQQRMSALETAQRIRMERARIKRQVREGHRDGLLLLANPPAELLTMRVVDLLICMPKIGRSKTQRILAQAKVSPVKTLGGLTQRQRDELVLLIPFRGLRP